jgi:glycerol uptake facilitator protein
MSATAQATEAARARPRWRRTIWGELSAEFLGTFVLISFGDGVVAMAVAALNQSGRGTAIFAASGDWLLITWGWAMAVTFGVYVAGGISGAHINPAVTLALAVRRNFPWAKVMPYIGAQLVGAFAGAALVYLVYHNAISSYEAAHNITRGALGGSADSTATFSIFATFPAPYFHSSMIWPLVDQIVGTAFLLMFVLALTDERNQPPRMNLAPLLVGLAVAAIGMSYGANAGYAINPARVCWRGSPAGARSPYQASTTISGCRSWDHSSAACWARSSTTSSSVTCCATAASRRLPGSRPRAAP